MEESKFKINPIIPLAYNMADCSRQYVLFIGAGVSKDAGIPSGWDILLNVLKKIRQQDENTTHNFSQEEMEIYYKEKHEEKFDYADIISSLYHSREEQREYLKNQFEGITSGEAHKLIAEMVNKNLIKFIITTNFDSLLEQALDDIGLRGKYTVISSDEDVQTSKPWSSEQTCRIYKINGTIEKGIIKNTKKDLAIMPENLQKDFLDIIERHGVITLGYAGNDYDEAISSVFSSRKFKGYTLYWTAFKGELSGSARKLINKHDGKIINIDGASIFLQELINRIELAQRGSEQTAEAVAEVRFETIIKSSNEVEALTIIEKERKNLTMYLSTVLDEVNASDYQSLWNGFVNVFKNGYNYLLLTEQIAKYKNGYWGSVIQIFQQIHSLNKNGDGYGKAGIINYISYCLLEIMGAILIENEKFNLLRELLEVKRLKQNRGGMEDVLFWNTQTDFIGIKNDEEAKAGISSKWIAPRFKYLLDSIAVQEFPLEFDIKNRLIEIDLIFFIYTVKNSVGAAYRYWLPSSSVYSQHSAPDLFKRIKHDKKFAEMVGKDLFGLSHDDFMGVLSDAQKVIRSKFQSFYFDAFGGDDVLDDFKS